MSNKVDDLIPTIPPLRVLHVIPSVAPCRGGPSKAVIEMVRALRKAGVNAEIAATNDDGELELSAPLRVLTEFNGAPVRFFKRWSPPTFLPKSQQIREFAFSSQFRSWLKRYMHHYDVVHVHAVFSFCSSYAMFLARKKGVPYIVRPIGQLEDWALAQSSEKKERYLKFIEQANIENANAVQFTADSERLQAVQRFPFLRAKTIPLGVKQGEVIPKAKQKLYDHLSLKEGVPTVLYLARLHKKKGLELLMQALAKLENQPYQLVIAGDGDPNYHASLVELSESLGMQRHCRFVSFVEGYDKQLLLQGADLYALTSYSENFGISVLEAMAAGTAPMVSSEVALSDVIERYSLGYVCSLDLTTISLTLKKALSSSQTTVELGVRAQDYVAQHYQWDRIAQQLRKLYLANTEPRQVKR